MAGPGNPVRNARWAGPERGTLVAEAVGDIDLQRSAAFQAGLMALLERQPRQIVLDLGGVNYMDSSGVASLVKFLGRVRRSGVGLKLAGIGRRVMSIFEITRLDTVFEIRATEEEALA